MLRNSFLVRLLSIVIAVFILAGSIMAQVATSPEGIPPIPETPQFDIDLADIYTELFPEDNEAYVICTLWLTSTFEPVILRMEGNLQNLFVSSKSQKNIGYVYKKPYLYLNNLQPGAHQVTFTYRVKHDGITSTGLISPPDIRLDAGSWWYPRNVALDAHQAILNIESPPEFAINSNATVFKNVPNNFKQLRQFILMTASPDGITLD